MSAWHTAAGPKTHHRRSCAYCTRNGPGMGCHLPFREVRPIRLLDGRRNNFWFRIMPLGKPEHTDTKSRVAIVKGMQ